MWVSLDGTTCFPFSVDLTKNMVADAFYNSYSYENKDILPNLNFCTQTISSVNANESAISASSLLAVPTLLLKLDLLNRDVNINVFQTNKYPHGSCVM